MHSDNCDDDKDVDGIMPKLQRADYYTVLPMEELLSKEKEEVHRDGFCSWAVTFYLFKQGLLVKILVSLGVIKSHHFWLDVEHLQESIQNVLICVEMVFFSVMQQYAYHVVPYSGYVEAKLNLKKDD